MHMEPPHITLIKSNNEEKSDKDSIKVKLSRDSMSQSHIFMNLKWPCLIKASLRSSCCSLGIVK